MTNHWRQIPAGWQKRAGIFPSVYRLLALGIAAAQMFTLSSSSNSLWPPTILISAVAVYTLLKITWPFHRYQDARLGYILLGSDIAVCFFLVLTTGGIASPFLLYTLSPVLTVALFFNGRFTTFVAALSIAYVLGSHLGNPFFNTQLSLAELSYFTVYIIATGLTATLPYMVNANLRQRLHSESITNERQRISRELHDGIAQTLTMLRWRTQLLQRRFIHSPAELWEVRQLEKLAEKAQYDARDAIDLLYDTYHTGRFLPNIRDYLERLRVDSNINVKLGSEVKDISLDEMTEIELLRISQEALTNIRKHSEARNVYVHIRVENGHFRLSITDDGHGFAPTTNGGDLAAKGYGLAVMKERADSIGGKLQVMSAPGHGTIVQVEIPRKTAEGRVLWQKR